jgi:hypothetical protein
MDFSRGYDFLGNLPSSFWLRRLRFGALKLARADTEVTGLPQPRPREHDSDKHMADRSWQPAGRQLETAATYDCSASLMICSRSRGKIQEATSGSQRVCVPGQMEAYQAV